MYCMKRSAGQKWLSQPSPYPSLSADILGCHRPLGWASVQLVARPLAVSIRLECVLSADVALRKDKLVRVELLTSRFSPSVARVAVIVNYFIILAFLMAMVVSASSCVFFHL